MKKKFMSILLSIVVALSLVTVGYADSGITVRLDGKPLTFDVQPQLIGGRTMVPLRVIFESLGATVEWDDSTKTVTAYNEFYIVNTTIGSNIMTVNGEQKQIDVPPMIVDSRTLVPARFVAEAFNYKVDWDGNSKTVYIQSPSNDYSQVEKGTGNVNIQGTTIKPQDTTVITNNSGYDELKYFLVTKGEKKYDEDGNTNFQWFDYNPEYEHIMLVTYNQSKEYIGIIFKEGNDELTSITFLNIEPGNAPLMIHDEEFRGTKASLYASFSNSNKPFTIEKNTFPSSLWDSTYNLINSELNLMSVILEIKTDVSLQDLGIYYEVE